jgi:hypothetical protein
LRSLRSGKYETTAENAVRSYHNAIKRVLAVLEASNRGDAVGSFDPWRKMVEERSGSLPKEPKGFLLNKVFGLRPAEIAEAEGLKRRSSAVRGLIIRVSDQLRSGEIRLFDSTPEETQEAKNRLDTFRRKRRERYAKKKDVPT